VSYSARCQGRTYKRDTHVATEKKVMLLQEEVIDDFEASEVVNLLLMYIYSKTTKIVFKRVYSGNLHLLDVTAA
jgi:hypothetical protein